LPGLFTFFEQLFASNYPSDQPCNWHIWQEWCILIAFQILDEHYYEYIVQNDLFLTGLYDTDYHGRPVF